MSGALAAGLRQSLAHGALGTALHLAVAAHTHPTAAQSLKNLLPASLPTVDGPDAGPWYGAPALALVLHCAPEQFAGSLERLDEIVETVTRTRLGTAHQRIDRRALADFAEYDVLGGLAGLAGLWLHRGTRPDLIADLLTYLVRLTEPISTATGVQPGWRVWHGHDGRTRPGPHTNNGLAHGISGPLAVLALAHNHGHTVPGQLDAILRVLAHLDLARRDDGTRSWWERWDGDVRTSPPEFSWCYGLPGMIRAQQLAAIAVGDHTRQRDLEHALAVHLNQLAPSSSVDPYICHGLAGAFQACKRIAGDATDPHLFTQPLRDLQLLLASSNHTERPPGILDGRAGIQLAAAQTPIPWDACLALT